MEKDSGGWHSILIKSLMCESDECMLYEVDDIHQTKPHWQSICTCIDSNCLLIIIKLQFISINNIGVKGYLMNLRLNCLLLHYQLQGNLDI